MEEVYIRGNIYIYGLVYWFMVFSATFKFNNISVISWQSVLLVEEAEVPRENHWPVASHWQKFFYDKLH